MIIKKVVTLSLIIAAVNQFHFTKSQWWGNPYQYPNLYGNQFYPGPYPGCAGPCPFPPPGCVVPQDTSPDTTSNYEQIYPQPGVDVPLGQPYAPTVIVINDDDDGDDDLGDDGGFDIEALITLMLALNENRKKNNENSPSPPPPQAEYSARGSGQASINYNQGSCCCRCCNCCRCQANSQPSTSSSSELGNRNPETTSNIKITHVTIVLPPKSNSNDTYNAEINLKNI